ncbi:MAG: ribosome-associated translation inhibitor RaiA [Proteobacteria bacterium]|nr:ribosome-associated translation inhibitor RaiA [Pseudomonadota bacterium]
MNVQVKGKQIDVGEALRGHVQQHLAEIVGKFFDRPLEATVIFSREAHLFRADISVHAARGVLLQSNSAANDPYPAFEEAASRMAGRLRRYKKRLIDLHHQEARRSPALPAGEYILDPKKEKDDAPHSDQAHAPLIVAEMPSGIDNLTVSEAVMRLDLADAPALMFRNAAHGGLNMVYRRADGNIGWVDPTSTSAGKK